MNGDSGRQDNPYQGNQTTPGVPLGRGIFDVGMPTGVEQRPTSQQVYGNNNYYNQTLKGHSELKQNIITNDQLSAMSQGMAPITTGRVEQMQREQIYANQVAGQPTTYNPYNSAAYNQLYMQPAVGPAQPTDGQMVPNVSSNNGAKPMPDISTAEGSIDYLNQIAPKDAGKASAKLSINSKIFVIAGVALGVIVAVAAIGAAMGGRRVNISGVSQEMGKNLANMQEILEYGDSNSQYTSGSLVAVTAETRIVMLSHQKQLGKVLPLAVDDDGEVTDAKPDDNITDDLEKAKAQGTLDKVYRDKLKKELTSIGKEAAEIYNNTHNSEQKSTLEATYNDVTELERRIEAAHIDTGGQAAD